jgi:nicotinamidase-related amidase
VLSSAWLTGLRSLVSYLGASSTYFFKSGAETMTQIDPATTALVLIGYQKDYFDPSGVLCDVIQESSRVSDTLGNTTALIDSFLDTDMLIINTPIIFSELYHELDQPMGILKSIRDREAFKVGTPGAETIPEILRYGSRILEVPGKRSFNAFSNTMLESILRDKGIERVLIAGCVTAVCVNATALHAFDSGFDVTVLSDCTISRTNLEQDFFCESIFPLYADVTTSGAVLGDMAVGA